MIFVASITVVFATHDRIESNRIESNQRVYRAKQPATRYKDPATVLLSDVPSSGLARAQTNTIESNRTHTRPSPTNEELMNDNDSVSLPVRGVQTGTYQQTATFVCRFS
jgi:hypothetical protein